MVPSFGADSAVLVHSLAQADPSLPVLFLDTGTLFAGTLDCRERLERRLGLRALRVVRPDPVEADAGDIVDGPLRLREHAEAAFGRG